MVPYPAPGFSKEELKRTLEKGAKELGIGLGPVQLELFLTYLEELTRWNRKINLTKITDPKEIITRHFLDSLTILRYLKGSKRLLDIGTGAGFPGLPVKIAMPEVELMLMDSVEKKVFFLKYIIRTLGLRGVRAVRARAEEAEVIEQLKNSFDCVVSRAISALEDFFPLARPYLCQGGILIAMKGPLTGKLANELEAVKAYNPGVFELEIPFSRRKTTLVILSNI
jgi:16S rRNA (guanine527-N7)-methyltransferase